MKVKILIINVQTYFSDIVKLSVQHKVQIKTK